MKTRKLFQDIFCVLACTTSIRQQYEVQRNYSKYFLLDIGDKDIDRNYKDDNKKLCSAVHVRKFRVHFYRFLGHWGFLTNRQDEGFRQGSNKFKSERGEKKRRKRAETKAQPTLGPSY